MNPNASAKSRRWQLRITLLQNALRTREALHRAEEALDNITRILFEEEEAPVDSGPPAAIPPPPPSPVTEPTTESLPLENFMRSVEDGTPSRPSSRPTVYQSALNGDALVQLLLRRWGEANSEDKREAVRDIVKRCLSTNAITAAEYADLQSRLK